MGVNKVKERLSSALFLIISLAGVFGLTTFICGLIRNEYVAHLVALVTGGITGGLALSAMLLWALCVGLPDKDSEDEARRTWGNQVELFSQVISSFCKVVPTFEKSIREIAQKIPAPNMVVQDGTQIPSNGDPVALALYHARELRLKSPLEPENVRTIRTLEEAAGTLQRKFQDVANESTTSESDPQRVAAYVRNLAEIAEVDKSAAQKLIAH